MEGHMVLSDAGCRGAGGGGFGGVEEGEVGGVEAEAEEGGYGEEGVDVYYAVQGHRVDAGGAEIAAGGGGVH